jgi:hypothetical protein
VVLGVACSIDSTVSVFTHSFLKEVCFAVEGINIHPWEGVGNIVDSRLFQFAKEAIGTESNGVQFTHTVCYEAAPRAWHYVRSNE